MKYRTTIKPWKVLSTAEVFSAAPWVKVLADAIELPSGRIVHDYYRVELPEYVMVYAENEDGTILCVIQYRHALHRTILTLPTGCVEPDENPIDAAKRELLEETGYTAKEWKSLGSFYIDGNKGCGRAHFYKASQLSHTDEPIANDMEETEIVFKSLDSVLSSIEDGAINVLATASIVALATHSRIRF